MFGRLREKVSKFLTRSPQRRLGNDQIETLLRLDLLVVAASPRSIHFRSSLA
jgi:hypothetical protein